MRKLLGLLGWLLVITTLAGCKVQERVVEVPVVHTENVYHNDTTFIHDSVISKVEVIEKDGTLYNITTNEKYIDRYVYKYRDSIRIDTVPKVVTVEKEVIKEVNKLNWFQSLLIYIGFATLLIGLIWFTKKFINK